MNEPADRPTSPMLAYLETYRDLGLPGHTGLVYLGPNRTGGATDAHELRGTRVHTVSTSAAGLPIVQRREAH